MSETKPNFTRGPWHNEGPDMFGDWNILHAENALAVGAVVSNLREPDEVAANAHLIAAAPTMFEALDALQQLHRLPGENSMDAFERIAAWFYRETGLLAPGKDAPAASGQPDSEERRERYDAWIVAIIANARAALARARGASQ